MGQGHARDLGRRERRISGRAQASVDRQQAKDQEVFLFPPGGVAGEGTIRVSVGMRAGVTVWVCVRVRIELRVGIWVRVSVNVRVDGPTISEELESSSFSHLEVSQVGIGVLILVGVKGR